MVRYNCNVPIYATPNAFIWRIELGCQLLCTFSAHCILPFKDLSLAMVCSKLLGKNLKEWWNFFVMCFIGQIG